MENCINFLYIGRADREIIALTLLSTLLPYTMAALIPGVIIFLAAWQDWYELRIDNKHVMVLAAVFPLLAFVSPGLSFLPGFSAALLMLFLGILLYAARLIGGGDVKLASAIALYIGIGHLSFFILGTALIGGVLAAVALVVRRRPLEPTDQPKDWLVRIRQGGNDIPYAVAMAVPTWFLLTQHLIAAYHYVLNL